jgi:hypothetical protein
MVRPPATPGDGKSPWRVGMLRPNGLRIIPNGRTDASRVLNPAQFTDPGTRHAYWVATQIPATLNRLYPFSQTAMHTIAPGQRYR